MKKRSIAIGLIVVLVCLQISTVFATAADERLAAVAEAVKKTLALNTEEYTQFYGDMNESVLAPSWYLEWSSEDGSLSVSATEDGKVLSYHRYRNGDYKEPSVFAPAFPEGNQEDAKQAAQDFLNRVLVQGETVTMEASRPYLGATQYRFYGEILVNGLSADLSYSISVNGSDSMILSFNRDDLNGRVKGEIPSPEPAICEEEARQSLKDIMRLRLEYVKSQKDNKAVLQYLPEYGDTYYVDAQTGALTNLSELQRNLEKGTLGGGSNSITMNSKEEMAADSSLSRVEQEGIDKLKDVLDKETLEQAARGYTALGLDAYTLSSVQYSVSREAEADGTYPVAATMQFGRQVQGSAWRRTVIVDAKSGDLQRVYSSAYKEEETERSVDHDSALKVAEQFAKSLAPEQFAKTELYRSRDALENEYQVSHSFVFAQKEQGYFFPDNTISLSVDATDGSISGYDTWFDDSVVFDDAEGLLTEEEALEAWMLTYEVLPQYVKVPYGLNYSMPEAKPLLDQGISYLYQLVLGYMPRQRVYVSGIDAKTGQPIMQEEIETEISYTDIAGHWAEEKIKELAAYGVGFRTEEFLPEQQLTQRDMLALLLSCEGYLFGEGDEEETEELYRRAYMRGLLLKEEREDEAVLTRCRSVRLILNGAGYGTIAQLSGIFKTGFADDTMIPQTEYGYVALAQGLGIVEGDTGRCFNPLNPTTRAEAAAMIYNLMK